MKQRYDELASISGSGQYRDRSERFEEQYARKMIDQRNRSPDEVGFPVQRALNEAISLSNRFV